jgi:hypothetical protein
MHHAHDPGNQYTERTQEWAFHEAMKFVYARQ